MYFQIMQPNVIHIIYIVINRCKEVGILDILKSLFIWLCTMYTPYLAAMTYNQVYYFQVDHLADFTQNGHTKIPVG